MKIIMIKKRSKPDLIVMLALILGLGLTLSGMSQSNDRQHLSQAEMQASGVMVSHGK
jgi:hypothetical protein